MPPELAQYGLAGLVIFIMAGVVGKLYTENKGLYKRIDDLQETRIQDARDTRDKLAIPVEGLQKSMDLIYEKLRDSKRGA